MTESINSMTVALSEPQRRAVGATLEDWEIGDKVRRLWARDPLLWTGTDESSWMAWLDVTEKQLARVAELEAFSQEVKKEGFSHALVLGMGGSSLCPEVLRMTFGRIEGFPDLLVLDSTDPAQIRSFERRLDLDRTLFIVSSKSGSTLEPNIFEQYFFDRAKTTLGAERAGQQFVAVTDPGSKLQAVAEKDRF